MTENTYYGKLTSNGKPTYGKPTYYGKPNFHGTPTMANFKKGPPTYYGTPSYHRKYLSRNTNQRNPTCKSGMRRDRWSRVRAWVRISPRLSQQSRAIPYTRYSQSLTFQRQRFILNEK